MSDIRAARDDLVPLLESYGVAAVLDELARQNKTQDKMLAVIEYEATKQGLPLNDLTGYQLAHLAADLDLAGKLSTCELVEGLEFDGVARAAAPSGIGCANGNVWANAPGASYIFRFYTNGVLKTTLTDYYITDLASIGATSGDTVQICQVVEGVPGWMAKIVVP